MKREKPPKEVSEYFRKLAIESGSAKKANEKRWEDHEKQTPQEKRKKWAAYMKEYRKNQKETQQKKDTQD